MQGDADRHRARGRDGLVSTTVVNIRKVKGVTPEFDVYIGRRARGFHQSKWHNPFPMGHFGDEPREQVLAAFRSYLSHRPDLIAALHELKGKRLGCWCYPEKCHGDVLAELADALP